MIIPEWLQQDVEIQVTDAYEVSRIRLKMGVMNHNSTTVLSSQNPEYSNQTGVVRTISVCNCLSERLFVICLQWFVWCQGGMCSIYLYEEEQEVTLPADSLGRVPPAKQDKVSDFRSSSQ